MKRVTVALALLTCCSLQATAFGQTPGDEAEVPPPAVHNPEHSHYQQQLLRQDDPWTAVRRKAEFNAAQRQQRLAAQKWFGFSNARPTVNATPWGVSYSATWASNTSRPFSWAPVRTVYVPVEVEANRR